MGTFDLIGDWSISGLEVSVVALGGGPAIRYPEAPNGFDSPLEAIDDATYVVRGGPFSGAEIGFSIDGDRLTGTVGGLIPMTRLDRSAEAAPGSGLRAPVLDVTSEDGERFRRLWREIDADRDGGSIDDRLTGSPRAFVQWLMRQDAVVFHGSNLDDIDEFVPERRSMELRDSGGRGNLGAVYGTHDGLWAMFFAIVDRSRLKGSMRNGLNRYESTDGARSIDLYHFSLDRRMVELEPYSPGTLYFLPRDRFQRIPFYPGGPLSNEWACHERVRPLARVTVEPSDFPFTIGSHDDGDLLVLGELGDRVYDGVFEAARTEDGYEIVTSADPDLVRRFIELSTEFYPDVIRVPEFTETGVRISMTGPPAFLHGIGRRLRSLLEE